MLAQFELSSDLIDGPRTVWVQNAGAAASDCLIFLDAEFYIEEIQAPKIIADLGKSSNLLGLTSIYVSHVDIMRRQGLTCPTITSFIASDLRHWIERDLGRFERVFLCGLSLSGLAAISAMLQHPTAFCGVLAQSPSAWWDDERLARSLGDGKRCESRVWISVGNQEVQENVLHSQVGLFQKASQRDSVRRLAEKLRGRCKEVHHEEFSGGHDMKCWATELPQALAWLCSGGSRASASASIASAT